MVTKLMHIEEQLVEQVNRNRRLSTSPGRGSERSKSAPPSRSPGQGSERSALSPPMYSASVMATPSTASQGYYGG
eukprot:CAMPEP_0182897052 /NCGR_PEP_ID=MMETSP0034_2-20130328/26658_1 /TAXON_ID=156128 /ORGANISM="Nephroselmis pyriformis, Strain CCMP717" /LENGTH=74 /DNA_ID=CAMNT_0025030947 /DNA_START=51 /DNA_END=272 /DNA_ORIENTATION=+